jgi:hypothetical protein
MDNESHSVPTGHQENHQEQVHALFFEEGVHDFGAEGFYVFVDQLVALQEGDGRSDEKERPAVRDVHGVQHQVEKVHVLLGVGDN